MESSILSTFSIRKSSRLSVRQSKCLTPSSAKSGQLLKLVKVGSVSEPRSTKEIKTTSLFKTLLQKDNSLPVQEVLEIKKDSSLSFKKSLTKVDKSPSPSSKLHPSSPNSSDKCQACGGQETSPECLSKLNILVSPKKRKSDENDFRDLHVSPIKTPKASPENRIPHFQYRTPTTDSCSTSPQTPKSSKMVPIECKSTPRRLFGSPQKKGENLASMLLKQKAGSYSTPDKKSPKKLQPVKLYKSDISPYQSAKRSLHTAKPDFLVGREKEESEIEKFITDRIKEKKSGSMYISGAPGTGKTAVVSHILDRIKFHHTNQIAFINCMMLKDSNTVFKQLLEQLGTSPVKTKEAMKALEKYFRSVEDPVLLVLDEIDQLDSKHHHVLYQIFEWPALQDFKVILIGIANALDLTDRILPRLQASSSCQPALINFPPYTTSQITDIIKNRLQQDSVLEPAAISFCARKISAVAGDARKALDVCHRAIELVESDVRGQQVLKPADCNSPTKRHQTPMKKVTVMHISKIMSEVYSSSVNSADGSEHALPLQQKLAICSLLLLVKSGKFKEVLLGKLHETYSNVCKRQQMVPVDQSEFHSVLTLLDSRGIIIMKKAKETRLNKISLKLDEHELEQTLKDKTLMAAILSDKIPK
ncbi:cell division control protein 6 [Biomphalaria glabrata]|nr:cell division control protein 6 [Biomphalaria glabrata]